MRLFVAEKPSVAKALAAELGGPVTRGNGYLSCGPNVRVTWCFGHILEMAMPEHYNPALAHWCTSDLPIIPTSWRLRPRRDAKQQLATIGKLLKEASEVVHAGDPDREGQLLVDEVLEHFANKRPVRRFWVSAQDSVSIQRGLAALKDNRAYRGLTLAALARSRADWLIGINLSRAYTLHAQRRALSDSRAVWTVGRVQTPTLALVVSRDRAIEAFKPVPHYTVFVELEHANGRFRARWQAPKGQPGVDGDGRLVDPGIASAVVAKVLGHAGVLTEYRQEPKTEGQPKAYTLTRLTLHASAQFGYTAEEVLAACQALYETHKLASYPRTDCEYLPESQHVDAPRVLAALRQVNLGLATLIDAADTRLRSKTWNDAKLTAHHGIIPTMHVGDLALLSVQERNVYNLIVRSYLAQFYPPHEFLQTSVAATIANEVFTATGRVVTHNGWRDVFAPQTDATPGDDDEHSGALPTMRQGDSVRCDAANRKDLKTKPPPRFTEGALQAAMENIYKLVEDPDERRILKEEDGIGTTSTRASIIGELKRRGFLRRTGKHLCSTELGQTLVDALPAAVKSPSLTALYERKLKEIEEGKGVLEVFLKQQEEFVKTHVAAANDAVAADVPSPNKVLCPECKTGQLRRIARKDGSGHFWGCSRYKEGCKATFPDNEGEPTLAPRAQEPRPEAPGEKVPCPLCGAPMRDRGEFLGCTSYPKCKATVDKRALAAAKRVEGLTTKPCPKCQKPMLPRQTGKAPFWACSGYPECKGTAPIRPIRAEKPARASASGSGKAVA